MRRPNFLISFLNSQRFSKNRKSSQPEIKVHGTNVCAILGPNSIPVIVRISNAKFKL